MGHQTAQQFHVDFRRVTPKCGAEVTNLDLSQELPETAIRELGHLLSEYGVLFFRDQHLSREQHRDFGRRFGELHIHPALSGPSGFPEIVIIHADENSKGVAGAGWHSDVSCDLEPPAGSILYMKTIPEVGGDTLFSNMYEAFESLSNQMQQYLLTLSALHAPADIYTGLIKTEKDVARNASNIHPVVRTHPVSKRKALYVNSLFTRRVVDIPKRESDYLLRFLFEHVNDPSFQVRFAWQPDSIAFWDNRCVQHFPTDDFFPATRTAERITICGERPYLEL